jgi:cell division protein ZapA (FtsZ GTPase activity inhibitor)
MQLSETAALVVVALTVTDELFQTQKNFSALKTDVARLLTEYDELKKENEEMHRLLEDKD